MKFLSLSLVLGLVLCIAGCTGNDEPTNVGQNADTQALADYEAQIAAEQEAANAAEAAASTQPGN